MKKVLLIKLQNNEMYIYPEETKIINEISYRLSPCVGKDYGGWSGYGCLHRDVEQPEWFQEPYMWCHMTDEGKLI